MSDKVVFWGKTEPEKFTIPLEFLVSKAIMLHCFTCCLTILSNFSPIELRSLHLDLKVLKILQHTCLNLVNKK